MTGISFAEIKDKQAVLDLFINRGMYTAGAIDQHVIFTQAGKIVAAAMLMQMVTNKFYLPVFAVEENSSGKGIGKDFLQKILTNPWLFTRKSIPAETSDYFITTISRGSAVDFYCKNGFSISSFSKVPQQFVNQCDECDEYNECQGQALEISLIKQD